MESSPQAGDGVPAAPGLRAVAPFVLGMMWAGFVVTYVIFDQFRYLKIADFFLYAGSFVIVPVRGYVEYRLVQGIVLPASRRMMFETFALAIIAASTFLRSPTALLLLVLTYLAGDAFAIWSARRTPVAGSLERFSPPGVGWVWARNAAGLALAVGFARLAAAHIDSYIYWPYADPPMAVFGMDITRNGPDVGRISVIAVVTLGIIYLLLLFSSFVARRVSDGLEVVGRNVIPWILAGTVLGYLMIDPTLFYESGHYNAYLGPMHTFRAGGWPLVDVFSQYGLSFLAYLPLGSILPFTYGRATFITNAFNIAMMLFALGMVHRIVGDRRFALPLGAAFIVVTWLAMPYNLTYTPSVFGVRWLPVWGLVLVLVARPLSPIGFGGLFALNLCALWSIESHFVAVIIFGFYAALASRLAGAGRGRAIVHALEAVPWSLVGHVLFVLLTLVTRGQLPSYGTYFELLRSYGGSENIGWLYPASTMMYTNIWLVFVVVYAALMFLALASLMTGRALGLEPHRLVALSVVAAAGIAQGGYFVGRPTQPMLALNALPLYTILCCLSIFWIDHIWRFPRGRRRELRLLGSFTALAVIVGVVADRASIGLNDGLMGSPNASMIVRCLRFGNCNPITEAERAAAVARQPPPKSMTGAGETAALIHMYNKWRGSAAEIVTLAPQRTKALIQLGVQDRLRANNLANDHLSPTLMAKMARALTGLPLGSLVITTDEASMAVHENELLCVLKNHFSLRTVDSDSENKVWVHRLDEREKVDRGITVVRRNGRGILQWKDGTSTPVTDGQAGYVDHVSIVGGHIAVVSGWAVDEAAAGVPKMIVLTLHDRAWVTTPEIERRDIAAIHPRFLRSGFKISDCDTKPSDLDGFRAYAVLQNGTARELGYFKGISGSAITRSAERRSNSYDDCLRRMARGIRMHVDRASTLLTGC